MVAAWLSVHLKVRSATVKHPADAPSSAPDRVLPLYMPNMVL